MLSWSGAGAFLNHALTFAEVAVSYIIGGAFLAIALIAPQTFLVIMHLCDVVFLSPPFFAVAVLVIALAELTPVVL